MKNDEPPAADPRAKVEVRPTADGSLTLYVPALDEHYHSRHGARQESAHVFIAAGLRPLLAAGHGQPGRRPLRLLEVGLGTGLNALLTLAAARAAGAAVTYDGYETQPLPPAVVAALRPEWAAESAAAVGLFERLHAASWHESYSLTASFY